MKKKNITLSIITLTFLGLILSYVSYAIISMGITSDEYEIFAQTSSGLVFTASGGNTFKSTISNNDMTSSNSVIASTSDEVVVTLDTDGKKKLCCTYDINWVWDTTDVVKNQYKISSGASEEYIIESSRTISYVDQTTSNNVSLPKEENLFHKQIPDYGALDNRIYAGTICNQNAGVLSQAVSQKYALATKFYSLSVNQDALRGGVFSGHLEIANISCSK